MSSDTKEFEQAVELWQFNAKADPMWAILSDQRRRGGKWKADEFFATGQDQIAGLLRKLEQNGEMPIFGNALDFGCGMGRLTQPLGDKFHMVVGVDVSPRMIELARHYNRHPDRVQYLVNRQADLSVFPDGKFDFVLSLIALQHVPPPANLAYLGDLVRVLAPGGVVVLQLPGNRLVANEVSTWRAMAKRWIPYRALQGARRVLKSRQPILNMYGIPRPQVEDLMWQGGDLKLRVEADQSAGPEWESFIYFGRKKQ